MSNEAWGSRTDPEKQLEVLETERDEWRKKAQTSEGILGFVLLTLDRPVFIEADTIQAGYPENTGIYIDTSDEGIEVGIRSDQ